MTDQPERKFYDITVTVSEAELRSLKQATILTTRGTYSEVIRQRLGWSEQPYGYVKLLRQHGKA